MTLLIDSHVHVMTPRRLKGLVRWILKAFPQHPVSEEVTSEDLLQDLTSAGVTHFFNFVYPIEEAETNSLNQFNLEFCQTTPGAIPFASLHPDTANKVQLAESLLKNNDYAGFKFHPFVQKFDPWDKRMEPFYACLQERQTPVFLHTGFEVFYQMEMPIKQLTALLDKFPDLPMVFVHMGFPELAAVFKLMEDHPALYLDATNVLAMTRPEYVEMIKALPLGMSVFDLLMEGLEKYSDRIMFGSDHPVGMGGLEEIYADLRTLKISDQTRANLSYQTAKRLIDRFYPEFDWSQTLQTS